MSILVTEGQRTQADYSAVLHAKPPKLGFSTYPGGSDIDYGYSIAVASDGSCYVTSRTSSSNFLALNAYNNTLSGTYDAFITKIH